MAATYSNSQSVTYEADGLARDVSPLITRIAPDETPFLSKFGTAEKATAADFSWFVEDLVPPVENAHFEMEEYKFERAEGIGRLKNAIQFFQKSVVVSDLMEKVNKEYNPKSELSRQATLKLKALGLDIERAIVHNDESHVEGSGNPAMTGGVTFFLQEELVGATFDNSTGVVTSAKAHELKTGRFVYFRTDGTSALPAELSEDTKYYVRLDASAPKTKFTLHESMEGAIRNTEKVVFTDDGTGSLFILKNNVVNKHNSAWTENDINLAMSMAVDRGAHPGTLVMSWAQKHRFTEVMNSVHETYRQQGDKAVKKVVSMYESDYGALSVMGHNMYKDTVIDIIDMPYWQIKWLQKPTLVKGIAKTGTYTNRVWEASLGVKATQPLSSARIMNIKR